MFAIGVDLGQRRDRTAIVAVEKDERRGTMMVRFAKRAPLGTPYPAVVRMVEQVVRTLGRQGGCELAVDATGVGTPVIEMLQAARLGCELASVTITAGDSASQKAGGWSVPKKDLMAGVQVALEAGELRIAKDLRELSALVRELVDVKATAGKTGHVRLGADGYGQHDDLVIALALACWKASRTRKPIGWGPRRLPGI